MARSVSVPYGAQEVIYGHVEGDEYDFQDFLDGLDEALCGAFPSLDGCDKWLGREDRCILGNKLAVIGVSEYCGLVSIWIVPDDNSPLAENWVALVGPKFKKIAQAALGDGALNCVGCFSNGEAIFEPVNGKQKGPLGLFSSKEGWL